MMMTTRAVTPINDASFVHRDRRPERMPGRSGGRPFAARSRRFVGGFYLSMGGMHLGIVAADPEFYRQFADQALFDFVRTGWTEIVMANPAVWGLLLFAGETVIGLLMLSARAGAVRAGWLLVISFHLLLVLFGAQALIWSVPVLAVIVPLAVRDWRTLSL